MLIVGRALRAIGQIGREFRIGLRRLRASPVFTLFAIGSLALGIGVTTAVYSFIYSFLWQDAGVRDVEMVVTIQQSAGYYSGFSGPEIADLRTRQTMLSTVSAWTTFTTALSARGTSELIRGEAVDGDFFALLGVEAQAGRLITAADLRPESSPVVVLSDAIWRRRFGADPAVVGTTVRMADRVFEVIGVASARFKGASGLGHVSPAGWVPLTGAPGRGSTFGIDLRTRESRSLNAIGRLEDGRTAADVKAQLAPLMDLFETESHLDQSPRHESRRLYVSPAFDMARVRGNMGDAARVILSLPALVLLVACTNLANLVLSRGVSRRHDFAVRRALGATRWRMIREQLVEGMLLAFGGGALGIVLASWLVDFAANTLRDTVGGSEPLLASFSPQMQPAVLAAAGGFALLALMVSSLIPALQLTRTSDRTILSSETGTGALPRWRGRSNLIALQVSVSVCLFLVTALGVTILATDTRDAPSGLRRIGVATVPFDIQQRDASRARAIVDRVLEEMRSTPGTTAGVISTGALFGGGRYVRLTRIDKPYVRKGSEGESAWMSVGDANAFRLLGPEMRRGRPLDDRDRAGATPSIVINEGLAGKLFGPGDATGRHVLLYLDADKVPGREFVIAGVSVDTLTSMGNIVGAAYVPFAQHDETDLSFVAQASAGDVRSTTARLATAIRRADPDLAITFLGRADVTGRWLIGVALGRVTAAAGGLATIALVLSMAGLFGVLSHVVAKRTRELGIRIALGAEPARIIRLILKDGFRPVLEGLFIGLGVAAVIRIALQPTFTTTITAFDPIAFVMAAGPLLIAGALACYWPARRASRVDPNVALRDL